MPSTPRPGLWPYRRLALPFERFADQFLAHATVCTTGSQSSIDDYSRDATDAVVFGPRCGFVPVHIDYFNLVRKSGNTLNEFNGLVAC